jgi:hypothetical protein
MCEYATMVHATPGIGGQMLQSGKMWLEFRQQVVAELSRGFGSNSDTECHFGHPAML